jgi:regulatory protein
VWRKLLTFDCVNRKLTTCVTCSLWLNTIRHRQRSRKTRKRLNKKRDATEPALPLDPDRARKRVFERAGRLLAAKPRSVAELRERLLEGQGATEAIVDTVIDRLREYGYLDDARFAQSYASLRVQQRPIGRQRLQRDLWLKKIDKQTADTALDQVFAETPETEMIDQAIARRVRLRGKPKDRAEARKLFDHLLRQGFAFELVSEKVRAVSKSEIDD